MWWKKKPEAPVSVKESIPMLIRCLELGMVDNAILDRLLAELDATPETLLPAEGAKLQQTGFLLWKCNRAALAKRLLFTSLAWSLKCSEGAEDIALQTGNIRYILEKENLSPSDMDIHQAALSGRFDQAASWRQDKSGGQQPGNPVLEIAGGKVTTGRTRYEADFTPLVSGKLPFTPFRGWLKRHDPRVLNPVGKLAMETIFPMFGEPTPQQYIARSERLLALGVPFSQDDRDELALCKRAFDDGVPVRLRRHRRYSGGDGLLPRGCYASVCRDGRGDDGGTLSRELLAYVDRRVPGLVYVCDSTNPRMNERFGIGVQPGFCAVYILLIAPSSPPERAIFEAVYGELLTQSGASGPIHVFAIQTNVDECEISHVIDLRLPETQRWFFEQFRNGDGHFLRKNGGTARAFFSLVPTLMHPALGGSEVTHGIGSWMRSSGVDALIFPSARSSASVSIENAALADWRGWNLVDYRTAASLPATELTESAPGWPDFLQPDVELRTIGDGKGAGSWRVFGIQNWYERLRERIEE